MKHIAYCLFIAALLVWMFVTFGLPLIERYRSLLP